MSKTAEIMSELAKKGSEQTRKTFRRHGAPENMFGVLVGELKKIAKKIKGEQALALDLFATGNSDAMYLAGLVADGSQMTKQQLDQWAKDASWYMISEYSVPWVTSDHPQAAAIARKWMKSKNPSVASSGWATYGTLISVLPDDQLDLDEIRSLLDQIAETIHDQPDRVRYTMNGFVIGVGAFVKPLLAAAKATAKKIGTVKVDMGETECKVPLATDYIKKIELAKRVGKKRAAARC